MVTGHLMLCWLAVQGLPGPDLALQWESRTAGFPWPLPFVVELCDQHSRPGYRLRVEGKGGIELPTRQDVLSSWPGGRARLTRVIPGEWPGSSHSARCRLSRHPPPASSLKLDQEDSDLELRGGAGRDVLTLRGGRLSFGRGPSSVALDLRRVLADVDGVAFDRHQVVRWQRQGPDPGGVAWSLELAPPAGTEAPYRLHLLVQVPQRMGCVSVQCTLQATQTFVLHRWSLPGQLEGTPRQLVADTEPPPGRDGALVWEALREAERTASVPVDLGSGRGPTRLTLRWSQPARQRPTRAWLGQDGRFRLDLVAGDLLMQQGQVLQHRLLLQRGATVHDRPQVLGPRGELAAADLPTAVWLRGWQEFLVQWARRSGAVEDRGCYRMPDGSFANGEFDLGGSLLELGRWTGQSAWLEPGLLMVHHTRDQDVAVDPPPPWPSGLRAMHGYRHGSERVEAGHLWADGLVQEVLLRGTPESLHGARDLAQGLLRCLDAPEVFEGPERRLAWPLRVATDVGRIHPEEGLRLAERLVQKLALHQASQGYLASDRRRQGGKDVIWVNVWVSLGITVESLLRAEQAWGMKQAGEVARRLGAWVLAEGVRNGGLAPVILVDPDTGSVRPQRGGLRAGGAALAAAGILRLADQGVAGGMHLDLAVDLWETALSDLGMPREHDLVELAKALQALRSLANSATGQALILGRESRPRRCSCRVGP